MQNAVKVCARVPQVTCILLALRKVLILRSLQTPSGPNNSDLRTFIQVRQNIENQAFEKIVVENVHHMVFTLINLENFLDNLDY